jgi:hypothetical protein
MMLDRIPKFDSNWWDCFGSNPFERYQSAGGARLSEHRVVA